jgi:hypothetical protein
MTMALAPQYDLFEDLAITELKAEIAAERESKRKMQKKLFAQMGDMTKMLFELYARIEQLESQKDRQFES